MQITWKLGREDVRKAKDIVSRYKNHSMVQSRIRLNLSDSKPSVTLPRFWKALASALMTTQQKSGPYSAVSRFINTSPFPLSYSACSNATNAKRFIGKTISSFGGLRRHETISKELADNLEKLQSGLWKELSPKIKLLCKSTTRDVEKMVADFLDEELKGLGPKQARNVLQGLGLTRFEIPIDSRITKWLNSIPFPVHLGAAALSDRNYYNFVMDGIVAVCEASGVFPCVLDAAVFVSFDGEGWNDDNTSW